MLCVGKPLVAHKNDPNAHAIQSVLDSKTFGVVDLCEGVINEGRLQRIRGFAQGVECGGCLGSQTATPSLCNVNSANFCTSLA